MKHNKYTAIGLALMMGLFFTIGCIGPIGEIEEGLIPPEEDDESITPPANDESIETSEYTGTWTGTWLGDEVEGNLEIKVDFNTGTVTGWFQGDAAGDISGSVSQGVISAEGDAMMGTVSWTGSFNQQKTQASGEWQIADGLGSGTWTGILEENEEEQETTHPENTGEDETAAWCPEGQTIQDQATGEEVEIIGLTTYEGHEQMCHMLMTTTIDGVKMEQHSYVSEDGETLCFEIYQEGELVQAECI